ncbi:hypothetical protein AB0G15_36765 [Streptosporangium sp. NPDC023825]|uniref:hypothetical protein n=1 Tax=Streptosporangium sp. NPDC023825 TaxID=3154909 RepID=UPI0034465F73
MFETVVPILLFGGLFIAIMTTWAVLLTKYLRQRRVLKYTDPLRAMDIIGRVRQLKVRGREEEAVLLVHNELAMPVDQAQSWVKSI